MTTHLSKPAVGFICAINRRAASDFIALFAEDAVIDDAGRIFQGREAIAEWAAHDIFAASVTLKLLAACGSDSDCVITAEVDGTFDRTGLPNPLVMTFQIVAANQSVSRLVCGLAKQ